MNKKRLVLVFPRIFVADNPTKFTDPTNKKTPTTIKSFWHGFTSQSFLFWKPPSKAPEAWLNDTKLSSQTLGLNLGMIVYLANLISILYIYLYIYIFCSLFFWQSCSSQPKRPNDVQADLHQLFGMLDSDGGGTIDPEEFKQTLTSHLGVARIWGVASCQGCRSVYSMFWEIGTSPIFQNATNHSATNMRFRGIIDVHIYLQLYLYYISVLASVHWSFPLNYPLIGQNSEDGTSMLRLPIVLFVMPWSSSWRIMPMLHKNSVPWRSVSQQYLPGNVSGWKGGDHHIGWPCDFWRKWKLQVERFVEVMIFSGGQWFTDHAWLWELWIDDDSSWSFASLGFDQGSLSWTSSSRKGWKKEIQTASRMANGFLKTHTKPDRERLLDEHDENKPSWGRNFQFKILFPVQRRVFKRLPNQRVGQLAFEWSEGRKSFEGNLLLVLNGCM